MSIKKILIICLIICCLFSLQAVVAESDGNSTDDVLTIDSNVSAYSLPDTDNQLREGSDVGSFSDLQNDLSLGGDIVLTKNYTFNNTIDTGLVNGISVPNTVNSITGSGKIVIDGSHQARIFNIHSNHSITLTGITFINANADGNGGSINSDGTLIISNCNFTNNTASGHGGAVYLGSGEGDTITNCNFEGNVAGENGGAIDWYAGSSKGQIIGSTFTDNTAKRSGGAVHWSGHYGTIRDSNFTNNIATGEVVSEIGGIVGGGDGGAVLWVGSNGTVDNCIFNNNIAQNRGGAIFLHGNSTENCTNTTLSHSIFINNTAGLNGGAVDWQEGAHDGVVTYCDFTNNTASSTGGAIYWSGHNGTILHSNFTNNKALGTVNGTGPDGSIILGGNGGAIVWKGAEGDIINTTFRLNNASRNGGAIFMQAGSNEDCSNITVDGGIFIENYAGVNGGALDWYEGAHDADLYNSVFINNTAERSGGAVYWFGHDGTIANSTFENNRALGNVNATDSYGRITPGGHGGAIMWTGANGIILNSTFRLNNASRNGGAIYMQGSTDGNCSNITVDDCDFIENYAGINGGALDWYEGAHDSTLSNSYFFNNTAERSGGAVYWFGHDGTIANSTFENNRALGNVNATDSYGRITPGGHGGAIMWTGANGRVLNSTFRLNNASRNGGAIYMQGSKEEGDCSNITVDGSRFVENYAGNNGGALDWYEGAHDSTLSNSYFIGNTAEKAGGAVYWYGHDGHVINSTFENNRGSGDGGALYVVGNTTELQNSTFNNNIAGDDGGAVYWTGDYGVIFNVTANNNKGISEGNSHSKGGTIIITGSHMTVDTLVVSNSFAEEEAGGLFLTGNYVNVTNAIFTKCSASMDGTAQNITRGGGAVIIGNNTRLINVTIEDSQAERGGAIYWEGNDGYAYNVTAARNYAPEEGGALFIAGENCQIYESEFTDNVAGDDGGAIYWEGDNGHIEGCNFENNTGLSMWNQYDGKSHTSKGGAVSIIGNDLKLLNSNFTGSSTHNNGNNNNFGGTLFITGEDVKIDGCDFNDSSSQGSDGGTIYIIGNRTEISNSGFSNSTARSGGAIYVDGIYTVIKGSEFDTCTANSPGAQGGAIYIHGQQTVVEESNFVNSSAAFRGGAIYIDGLNAIIRNSNFTDSSVSGEKYYNQNPRGGAVYIKENYATIEGSIFNHSTVSSDVGEGGAIFVQGNYANVSGSEFESSSAKTGGAVYLEGNSATVSDSTFTSSHANENGGAMYSTGSNSVVSNSNFTGNLAELSGGAIYWYGGANSRYNTVDGCIFTNNTAHGNTTGTITRGGGAVYWSEGGYYGTIKNSEFYYNSVQSTIDKKVDGGAVLWDKSYHALVDNCIFVGNFVTTNGDTSGTSASDVWAQGGAMYLRPNANYTIRNCLFENCSSSKEAGALYIQGLASSSARMITLEDSVFINNVAQANGKYNINGGGAIQIKECPHAVFNNITFINNTANKGGGLCVYNSVSDLVVTGVNFTGNKANRGSAISASVFFTLNDAVLLDNRADTTKFDLDFNQNSGSVDIVLEGADTHLNSMYIKHGNKGFTISCNNVTYWTDNNITTGKTAVQTGTISSIKDGFAREAGIPVLVEIFDGDNNKLYEGVYATDADGKIHLEVADVLTEPYQLDDIYVNARLLNEDYYTRAADTSRDKDVYIDASALDTIFHRNTTVTANITGKTGSILQSARGIISVYIDDVFKGNMTIENGKGSLENILTNFTSDKFFEVGNHTVFLKYWGDAKYNEVNTTVSFNITKAQSNLTVSMDDMGYNLYMNFTITDDWDGKQYRDANGTATVEFYSVDDPTTVVRFVDVKVVDGFGSIVIRDLLPRNYTIMTIYHDDHNYNGSSYEANYTMHQKEFAAVFIEVNAYDIMVNDTVYINVTIVPPEGYDVPGNVTLYLDNIGYNLTLTMGATNATATFNKTNLTAGIKKVIVFYEGSKLLGPAKGEADFKVHKYDTPLSADVANITVIQNEIINITLSNDTTGVVSVIVDGKEYFGRVKNGTVSIELPKLPVGKYNVTLFYEGDSKYNNATNYTVFYVIPVAPEIIIDVDNVTYGNETLIVVTLPEDATGNVTVKINDTYYVFDTQNLTDGKAILPGVVLPAGNYTVEVTYNGDENYAANTNSANFTVYKAKTMLNITVEDIYYGEEANITVTVPEGITGNITIKINGTDKNITLPIVDGKVNWTVGGLAVGNHVVIANYSGNANYTDAVVTDDFNVLQIGTVLDVDVHNIPVWDTEYVNVTIKDAAGNIITNATGNVTMNINGVDYTAEIKDGVARFNISNFTVGHKVALVFYDGDRNITGNRSKAEFDVTQRVPAVNVTALNITVDQEGKITIHIPANATGFVILSGNFTKRPIYVDEFTNGVAEITLDDLAVGNYSVHIKYYGDEHDNYTVAENDTTFRVDSINTTISIDVESIDYGNKANITVTVNNNATGYITIKINETRNITLPIAGGKVNWIVEDLAAGNYTVYASYSGDGKYNVNETNKTFEVRQISPNVEIIHVGSIAGENATIIVRVNPRVTENVTIEVGGKQYSMAVDAQGMAIFTTDVLKKGNYTIVASYPGDRNFTVNSTEYTFTTNMTSDYVINITASDIYVGNNTNITVYVPSDATGNVIIELNGTNYTVAISQGKAVLNNISTLKEGVYNVIAYFGNDNYVNKTVSTRFTVSKVGSPIKVDVESILYVDDTAYINVTVPDDNAGNVTIEINGKVYGPESVTDGVARFVVPNVTYGNKTVAITYSGTDKYVANFTTANFIVSKRTPIVNVTNITVIVGNDAVINISGPSDRNGNLIVTVAGADYAVKMTGGNATLTVEGLSVGNYTVSVTYIENDKYVEGTASGWVNVTAKGTSAINITVEDVYYVGEEIVITLTPVNSTGNISVTINGQKYNITNNKVTIENGLPMGTYEIVAVLDEDENYYGSSANATFQVVKKNITISVNGTTVPATIYVGSPVTITANLNESVTGDVIFTINGANYTVHITDSKVATIEYTPVNNDTITVVATFMGNDNYNGNVSDPQQFNVNRIPTDISVTVKTPVTYGEDAVITVELIETINATVKLIVDGKEYDVAIINGKGGLNVSGLNSGDHKVNVTYVGDDKYVGSKNSTSFTVGNATLVADVTAFNVTVEQNTTFVINVPDDFNGNVSIKVGDKVLYNGSVKTLVISDKLPAGDKTSTVVFYGDSNYDELTLNDVKFTVSRVASSIDVIIDDVTYPDKAVAFINVGNDANGTVNITVDGKVFTGTVSNGVAQVDLPNLSAGNKVASVEFFATDDYNDNATASAKFTVLKANTTLDVEFKPVIYVNETQIINITVNNTNATGNVIIMIGGKNYTAPLTNGRANFTTDLLPYGNYTLTVIYEGDKNLTGSWISETIEVRKLQSNLTITVTNVTTASDETIKVNVTSGATGSVVITVDGKDYYVDLDNGVATLVLNNLTNKTYTVHAKYLGDDNYTTCEGDASFNVAKVNSTVSVKVENITVGDVAVVNITVTSDATGNVTVEIVGVGTYTVPVASGTGVLVVKDLEVGTYTVKVTYNGDGKYLPSNNETTFKVSKADSGDIKVVDQGNRTVVITVPGKEGNVTVKVGNNTYNATVVDGVATVDLINETPGPKDITVIYSGDESHPNATANATVSIPKYDTPMSIEVANSTVGNVTKVIVNVPKDVKDNVTVSIDGKTYSAKPVDGQAVFEIEGLIAGNKTVTASYAGDDWFVANFTVAHFKVDKVASSVNVTGDVINVGENATISITGPKDYNGTAVVNIDGKNYTVSISNGIGQLEITGLANSTYDVKVTLLENDKYLASENDTAKVMVNKVSSYVTVNVDNITVGDVAIVNITVPTDATGNVTVEIVGIGNYTVPVADGTGVLVVKDLKVDTYTVKVTYNGDGKYLPNNNETTFKVSKVDSDDIKVVDQGNGTVVITVPGEDGNVTVKVGNDTYNVTVVNGTAVVTLNNLTPGEHEIEVIYSGDENHNGTSSNATVSIPKYDTPMSIEVANSTVGNVTKVIVNVPKDVKDNVTVSIDGKTYSAKPVDGQAVFEIEGLIAGNKTVTASYAGDDWFVANFTVAHFKVDKVASSVNVTGDVINVGENATISITGPKDYNGTAVVNIDGKNYTVSISNGVGQLEVTGLANSTYDVKVTLLENDKYLGSENDTAKVMVNKVSSSVTVNVDNITVGDVAIVNITVPSDATGNVTVEIVGVGTYTVPVASGTGVLVVKDLKVDTYTVKVTYNGDGKYLPNNNETTFKVSKVDSDDIKVVDQGNGTVVITVPGEDGNVTVKVGNETYNATVVNGTAVVTLNNLTPGEHEIEVIYSGDENHNGSSTNATVDIPKYDTPMSIEVANSTVGNVTKVIVNVPKDVKDNVTVSIDGKTYSVKPVDGKAVFEIEGLIAGNKTVTASYAGDDWFVANFTVAHFKVDKVASSVNVTGDVINVGENATISITGPKDYNGTAVVNIDGKNYTVSISNGIGQLEVTGLANSTYDVKVTLLENDKYLGSENDTAKVMVNKVSSYVTVNVDNITVGDVAIVNITVPTDATGNVTVEIVGVGTYTVPVASGTGVLVVKDLKVDTYTVKVTYNGDGKYLPNNNETTFKVSKVDSDDIKVVDQGNGTVVITVPGEDGNVTVKVGNDTYNVTVVNGTAVVTLNNATPGKHEIEVIYSGDENHNGTSTNATVNIPKYDTPMSIEVSDGKVGEKVKVTVNVPGNATGNVTIEINGKTYTKKITDGQAVFEVEGLLSGNKTVTATYEGDDNYVANSTTNVFTVYKNPAPISATVDNSTPGQATIEVTLPSDATGYVIVNVNGTDYGINLTAGDKSVTIPIEDTGDYTAVVTYLGDEKYLGNSTTLDFHATSNKTDPNIAAEVGDVPVGNDVVVKVTVPQGGDGNVTITVDGKNITVPVKGGENEISIPGVSEGTHDVVIKYSGNDQYDPQTVTKKVTVFRSIIAEDLTRGWNSPYDYKAEFLDSKGHVLANTNVKFIVNGKTYTVKTDFQGIARLDKSKLPIGKYEVTIINPVTGEQIKAKTTIVKRLIENKDITMDFVDGTYYVVRAIGDDGKPVGEGEFVEIGVHTICYSCKTDKDGYARLKINLNPDKYPIAAEYKNYKVHNNIVVKQTLKVKKTVKATKGKKLVLKAKLRWTNGKPITGKKIVFKFKGKTYKAKTNSKGVAKVTIKKKITKKLKKGKKYKYSAKYLTNKVKGKVKVKK